MDKYVLLLGAVNVSGKNKLLMKDLASQLSDAGDSEVKTYIQSGNIVLCHARRPDVEHIGQVIEQGFGFFPLILHYSAE